MDPGTSTIDRTNTSPRQKTKRVRKFVDKRGGTKKSKSDVRLTNVARVNAKNRLPDTRCALGAEEAAKSVFWHRVALYFCASI